MKPLDLLQTVNLTTHFVTDLYSLLRRPYWSHNEIQKYQLERINYILSAAKMTPHFKNLPKQLNSLKELEQIPILTKQQLLEFTPGQVVNSEFKISDLIVSKSSGSTGKALDVYYDEKSYNLFILAGLRLYLMAFRYMPWHRQTYIYTSPYPINSLFGLYPMEFISTLNPIDDTIERLRKNPPDILVCYPSHLRSIADKMTPEDFKRIRPQAINVNSEMSSQAERDFLAQKFHSFVFDDYSSEELTRIASQCRELNYHIFDDVNFIEVVDDLGRSLPEGEVGNIVGTNLHNIGMPLIRYSQGDQGALRTKKCACGRNFRVLEKLIGRKNDAFLLSTGESISSGYLLDLTYSVFLDYAGAVNAFCLVQEEPDRFVLELVPGQNWSPDLPVKITTNFKNHLKKDFVKIETVVVREVRKTKSGKANPIISLVKK